MSGGFLTFTFFVFLNMFCKSFGIYNQFILIVYGYNHHCHRQIGNLS